MNKRNQMAMVAGLCVMALTMIGRGQQVPAPDARQRNARDSMTGGINVMLPPPLTRLEAFAAQRGVVITKGYTDIGILMGDDSSSVTVTAVRLTDGTSHASGVAVQIAQHLEGQSIKITAYVDENEIDSLISACESLSRLQDGVTGLEQFEARYQTLGAMELVSANLNGGRVILVRAMEILPGTDQRALATSQFFISRLPELWQPPCDRQRSPGPRRAAPAAARAGAATMITSDRIADASPGLHMRLVEL